MQTPGRRSPSPSQIQAAQTVAICPLKLYRAVARETGLSPREQVLGWCPAQGQAGSLGGSCPKRPVRRPGGGTGSLGESQEHEPCRKSRHPGLRQPRQPHLSRSPAPGQRRGPVLPLKETSASLSCPSWMLSLSDLELPPRERFMLRKYCPQRCRPASFFSLFSLARRFWNQT